MMPTLVVVVMAAVTVASCTSAAPGSASEDDKLEAAKPPPGSRSTIVAEIENYYEESTVLDVDPCYDRFIVAMGGIGYSLVKDVLLPRGGTRFGRWSASCHYQSNSFAVLVKSSENPIMAPGQTLAPTEEIYGWSHFIDIAGRTTIVTPPSAGHDSCDLSMTTRVGSLSILGHARSGGRDSSVDSCAVVEDLARRIEPWIEDGL